MPIPIVVPKSTISMSQGAILQWLKKVGESVVKDETLLELETDKAVVELPAPADGTLLRIDRDSGEVAVDQVIGWIGRVGDAIPFETATPRAVEPDENLVSTQTRVNVVSSSPPLMATPAARRRAQELGIDLKTVRGSGPAGRITEGDVDSHAGSQATPIPSGRRTLADHVTEAWKTVPHIHIVRLMDVDELVRAKDRLSTEANAVTYTDLVLSAAVKTLPHFPQLLYEGGGRHEVGISVALAIDTDNGVVTPAIQRANTLTVAELACLRRQLTSLAQARKLRPEHLQPASFTVTNLGMFEVDLFAPIINTPQIAILATGQIKQHPAVEHGQVRAAWRMWATLAADHRHVDGALAAKFLSALQVELNRISESQ